MAIIDSVKLPDNSTYDLTDNYSGYQTETLATPITVNGTSETTVEGALGGLNDYGNALADNLAADEESGAKNFNVYPYYETTKAENGLTFTDNGDGTVTVSGTAGATTIFYCHRHEATYANGLNIPNGNYKFSGAINSNISANLAIRAKVSGAYELLGSDLGAGLSFTIDGDYYSDDNAQLEIALIVDSGTVISTPITFKPMICDDRVIDPTFAPFAETNLQLTQNKAERADISTIHATGSTNTTGAQIDAGTFFYLNGQFCKALTNIAVNATLTLNTNFEVVSVGGVLSALNSSLSQLKIWRDVVTFEFSNSISAALNLSTTTNGVVTSDNVVALLGTPIGTTMTTVQLSGQKTSITAIKPSAVTESVTVSLVIWYV